jgi:hypothetical protein
MSRENREFRVSLPSVSRRFSLIKSAGRLPIFCLSCTPITGSVRPKEASASNSQIVGSKEDRLISATERNGKQDAANDIHFGC